jgi:phage terminase large subunit
MHYMACAAHERIANYWYLLPEYSQAKKAIWEAINPHTGKKRLFEAFPPEIIHKKHEDTMMLELKCGSTIKLVGSDNPDSLVGSPPVGLVKSEDAVGKPQAWAYLMPILEENGGWAIFNSTPRGKNHFYKTCLLADSEEDWYYDVKTVDDTDVFRSDQLERIRRQLYKTYGEEYGEAMFQQEYYVSFDAAQIGAIWADCIAKARIEGRIGDYPHNQEYPVHCVYDLGKHDYTSIWFFQVIGSKIYIIDWYENNHKEPSHYFELLANKGYRYGAQFIPHDAYHDRLGMGAVGNLEQQWKAGALKYHLGEVRGVPNMSIQASIQSARETFPAVYFNEDTTDGGIECLISYAHKWDDDKKRFSDEPEHNWASHTSDAFRYLSTVWRIAREIKNDLSLDERLLKGNVFNVRLGTLKNQHLKKMKARRNQ